MDYKSKVKYLLLFTVWKTPSVCVHSPTWSVFLNLFEFVAHLFGKKSLAEHLAVRKRQNSIELRYIIRLGDILVHTKSYKFPWQKTFSLLKKIAKMGLNSGPQPSLSLVFKFLTLKCPNLHGFSCHSLNLPRFKFKTISVPKNIFSKKNIFLKHSFDVKPSHRRFFLFSLFSWRKTLKTNIFETLKVNKQNFR
jgi:hypothetical protein